MSAKTNTPPLEPPVQHSCLQCSCCPDVQHADSGEQGGRAPAHHHQQHRERERWAWAQMSCGDTLGVHQGQGVVLVGPPQQCCCLWRKCRYWSPHPLNLCCTITSQKLGVEVRVVFTEKQGHQDCIHGLSQAVDGHVYVWRLHWH